MKLSQLLFQYQLGFFVFRLDLQVVPEPFSQSMSLFPYHFVTVFRVIAICQLDPVPLTMVVPPICEIKVKIRSSPQSISMSVNKLPDHDQDIGKKDIQVTVVIGLGVSDLYCHRDTSWGG